MKCFYHNDIDGLSAAAIVARFTNNYCPDDYIEYDYSKPIPVELINSGETVYFVDLSFSVNTVDKLKEILEEKQCDLIYCDHHTSTMEIMKQFPEYQKIKGIRREGISGAALTWMYFNNCTFADCPTFIQLISDFDCWKFDFANTIYFKYALEAEDISPFSNIWNRLCRDSMTNGKLLKSMIEDGKVIEKYTFNWYSGYCKNNSYESEIDGLKCLVCNIRANSLVFGSLINNYPVVAIWVFDGTQYKYSIYSNKENVDCSKIAEKFGGGGHKGAAGFVSTELILKRTKKEN